MSQFFSKTSWEPYSTYHSEYLDERTAQDWNKEVILFYAYRAYCPAGGHAPRFCTSELVHTR
jgi:hypothetical protein